jgi:hypothetical protein
LLNADLQKRAFKACDGSDSNPTAANAADNMVIDVLRTGIDTKGINEIDRADGKQVQQMVSFLKACDDGVNVFVIVIRAHEDSFVPNTRKWIKRSQQIFNNARFWDQVCIVFTKCFRGVQINQEVKKTRY